MQSGDHPFRLNLRDWNFDPLFRPGPKNIYLFALLLLKKFTWKMKEEGELENAFDALTLDSTISTKKKSEKISTAKKSTDTPFIE